VSHVPGRFGTPLTPREIDVLAAYARTGYQKRAAEDLGISVQTFKNHTTSALHRLGVTTSLQAFVRLGWLRPGGRA